MINGTREAATTRSTHNFSNNAILQRNPTGQENRKPLLHRIFGGKNQASSAAQSSSVGATARVGTQSFLSGGSNRLKEQITNNSTHSVVYGTAGPQGSQKSSSMTLKDRHLPSFVNQSVVSAAPPSHPPALAPIDSKS